MKFAALTLLLVGCATLEMPDAVPSDAAEWSAVRVAWTEQGYADCADAAPREAVVDAETFEALCTAPPLVPPTSEGARATCADAAAWSCLMACTVDAPDGGGALIVLAQGWWDRPGYLRQTRAHEMLHALAECTGVAHATNAAHALTNVWGASEKGAHYALESFAVGH